jgi:iron complex transport system substrate-binding protein
MSGRSVRLPVDVTRVATDYPALDATMLLLGDANRIVATSTGPGPLFDKVDPSFAQVPTPFSPLLTSVNVEALLATHPQVVFISPASSALLPTLQRAGIPVVEFATFDSPSQLEAGVNLVAQVLGGGAPARARKFDSYYDANIARVVAVTSQIPKAQRPTAYYTAANPLQTEGQNSIVDAWMSEAGVQNVAALHGINTAPAFATVTLEDVVNWNPAIIVCRGADTRQAILSSSQYRTIAAVRNHRVYVNPSGVYVWSVRSAESALEPLWAAKTFYPDRFRNLNLTSAVKDFYAQFYDYKLSDAQVRAILNPTATS